MTFGKKTQAYDFSFGFTPVPKWPMAFIARGEVTLRFGITYNDG